MQFSACSTRSLSRAASRTTADTICTNKPRFLGSSAAAAIYKARGGQGDEDSFGGGTEEGISEALDNNDFGLGVAKRGFEGAAEQDVREGPVYLEKDMTDMFGVDEFWNKVIS